MALNCADTPRFCLEALDSSRYSAVQQHSIFSTSIARETVSRHSGEMAPKAQIRPESLRQKERAA